MNGTIYKAKVVQISVGINLKLMWHDFHKITSFTWLLEILSECKKRTVRIIGQKDAVFPLSGNSASAEGIK